MCDLPFSLIFLFSFDLRHTDFPSPPRLFCFKFPGCTTCLMSRSTRASASSPSRDEVDDESIDGGSVAGTHRF
jgi:hypothetical protein